MNRFIGEGMKNRLYFIKSSSASSAFWFLALDNRDRTRKAYECCFVQLNCEITLSVVRIENKLQVITIKLNVKRVSYVDRLVPRNEVPRFVPVRIGPKTKTRNSRNLMLNFMQFSLFFIPSRTNWQCNFIQLNKTTFVWFCRCLA